MPRGHAFTLGQPRATLGARNRRAARNIPTNRAKNQYSALAPLSRGPSCTIRHVTTPSPSHPRPLSLDWFPRVNKDRLLADLDALLTIPSLGGTRAEVDAQRHLADCWTTEGLEVTSWEIDVARTAAAPDFPGMEVDRDQALGVIARLPGTGGGRTLLIDGHTDVVPPGDLTAWSGDPFIPRTLDMEGRRSVVARGACDMKAGLIAAWEALRMVREAGLHLRGDVIVCPVSGEEDGGLGTFAAIEQLGTTQIDGCIVPEPTDLDLIPANGGALTFRLRVPGAAIHASRRSEGVSAIEKFVPILNALMQLETSRNANVDPLMQRWPIAYPMSIGTVQAGDWASTVPDLLIAEGRLGVALGESAQTARQELESAVAAACADDPWLREHPVTVEWWGGQFHSGRTDPSAEVIRAVRDAHHRATGLEPDTYGGPYGSDLRLLVGKGGIPTVQYGPGDSRVAHAPDEYVAIDDVVTCSAVLADVIVEFCS